LNSPAATPAALQKAAFSTFTCYSSLLFVNEKD